MGVLQYGVVAEVVLVRGLDAEGSLCPHAPHRLANIQRAHVLELRQTDVQGTEGTCERQGSLVTVTPSLTGSHTHTQV